MGTLHLIRHGQASYGAVDYDNLSPLGQTQARALADEASVKAATTIYAGPLRRQRDTATLLGASPIIVDELAEYPAFELIHAALPQLLANDPAYAALAAAPTDRTLRARAFDRIIAAWSNGTLDVPGIETFAQFTARVQHGLTKVITNHGSGSTLAVVTSAGPISIAVGLAMASPPAHALLAGQAIRNASVSSFRFRSTGFAWQPGAFSLIGFNHVAHLPGEHHTYV